MYAVAKVKQWTGTDGYGFQCSLTRNGKHVAQCTEAADGTIFLRMEWDNDDEEAAFAKYVAENHANGDDPELTLPKDTQEQFDRDAYITELVDEYDVKKKLTSRMKTKTFGLDGGKIWVWKAAYTPAVAASIRTKLPNVVILNELPIDEAVKISMQHS